MKRPPRTVVLAAALISGVAVAALILDMEGRGTAVKSVTRGDTAVTYAVADGQSAALAGLAPWRRLGRLKEG